MMTGADVPLPSTCGKYRRSRRDAPAADHVNTFRERPLHCKSHSTICHTIATGGCPCGGARAPESTLSPENPESNTHRESRTSDSKTSQNHRIPLSGCPCFPHMRPVEADPRCFSQKTGSFFPDQEPPLFFGHSAPPGIPEVPDNLLNLPFSAIKGRPLNCTVFFHLKWPVSKNTGLKRESWRGLAPLPLELPGHDSGLVPLRRRIDHGRE